MQVSLNGAKCLVAGGSGFLGHHTIRRLLEQGAHVRATLHDTAPAIEEIASNT